MISRVAGVIHGFLGRERLLPKHFAAHAVMVFLKSTGLLIQRGHRSGWRFHTGTAAWLRGPPGATCLVGGAGVSPATCATCLGNHIIMVQDKN